ncbi:hypothetical protein SUGI_0846590 [Cryptomeria japonica]|nr:hypothetical protein SUGI_0846590 [Cryptomeria japonica]
MSLLLSTNQSTSFPSRQPSAKSFSLETRNEEGVLQWQATEVNIDNHVFVPEFPAGHMVYDKFVEDYVSDMHTRKLPHSRPLWEFHFLNYKTTKGEATVVINLHHMLGDDKASCKKS